MNFIIGYVSSLVTLIILDSIWLGLISKGFYKHQLGHLFQPHLSWSPIIVFYLIYAAAIVFFVVSGNVSSWPKALLIGAVLGLTAYATYDLVNAATLKDWPLLVVTVDIAWGVVITAAASIAAWLAMR